MKTNYLILNLSLFSSLFSYTTQASDLEDLVEQEKNDAHWSGLPVWGEEVKAMGYELPIPIGFGVYMNSQDVEYVAMDDFKIDAIGGLLGGRNGSHYVVPAEDVTITGQDKSIQLRADAWVLPFLNVYTLAGYTQGTKSIKADLSNATKDGNPFPVPATIPINLEYDAYNIGLGGVLATQFEVSKNINPIIFTLAGAITKSKTTATDSIIKTRIGSVRVGQRYDVPYGKLAVLAGYQYQNIEQNVSGSIADLGKLADKLDFDVDLKSKEVHNMSIAMVYDFGYQKEWNIMAEYGFLNWTQFMISAGYRF
ncbi:MAG: hypothetical protein ACPG5L_15150 [Vibrio gallaecicus]